MHVVLVRPPFISATTGPPTGLAYLAAVLRRAGHQCTLLDLNLLVDERRFDITEYTRDFVLPAGHPACVWAMGALPSFCEQVLALRPDVVGFTLSYPTWALGVAMAERLCGTVRCIAGGPMASFHPERLLGLGPFDAVVEGYGEEAVLDALAGPGLFSRPLQREADYRPDYEGLDLRRYHGHLSVLASRGCPNRCAFCTQHLRYFLHPIESVAEQIERYRPAHIMYNDSNINASASRCEALFTRLAAVPRIGRGHVFGMQVKRGFERYVPAMAQARVREVRLGIESGSLRERRSMNKPAFDDDLAVALVRDLTRHGIQVWAQFIFAYPDQTDDDRERTVALMRRFNEVAPKAALVRHFWYRFMVHHGTEDLFTQRYGVRTETPMRWTNDLYTPEGVEDLGRTWQARIPGNCRMFL